MADGFPNSQSNPLAAIPARLTNAAGTAFVDPGGGGAPYVATPLGYQQITPLTTAQALTVPATATFAIIQAESVDARWRDDGTAPTASIGMLLWAGQLMTFSGDLSTLRFIQTQAAGTINISYYK